MLASFFFAFDILVFIYLFIVYIFSICCIESFFVSYLVFYSIFSFISLYLCSSSFIGSLSVFHFCPCVLRQTHSNSDVNAAVPCGSETLNPHYRACEVVFLWAAKALAAHLKQRRIDTSPETINQSISLSILWMRLLPLREAIFGANMSGKQAFSIKAASTWTQSEMDECRRRDACLHVNPIHILRPCLSRPKQDQTLFERGLLSDGGCSVDSLKTSFPPR